MRGGDEAVDVLERAEPRVDGGVVGGVEVREGWIGVGQIASAPRSATWPSLASTPGQVADAVASAS